MSGETLVKRFMRKVEPVTESGCWIWMASTSAGYGQFKYSTKWTRKAHRVSYELFVGLIPDGMCVCHHCDVRVCVNPAHLFLGTHKDNLDDMHAKGRQRYPGSPKGAHAGSKNGRSKLTAEQALEIRSSPKSLRALAREFGVSKSSVLFIKKGRNWRHLQ